MRKKNMVEWKESIITSQERKAMPLITYPGLNIIGKSVLAMVSNGEVQYESIKALSDRYCTIASTTMIMALSVEAEAFGSKIIYSHNKIPIVEKKMINSLSSVSTIRIPEVGEGKTSEQLKAARLAVENITDHPVFGGIIGPYSLAGQLFGIAEILADTLLNPEEIHKLIQLSTEFLIKYAQAFKNIGCNGLVIAEPTASLLAEKECDKFSSYYVKQIVSNVQDENFIVILHNCGDTVNLVNSMVSTGCIGFHFGNAVNILDILPKVPSDCLVFGNLDPVALIKNGTPEIIRTKTLDLLNKTASFKNFVLSTGCDVPPGTNIKNIDTIFDALNEYNERQLTSYEIQFYKNFKNELSFSGDFKK